MGGGRASSVSLLELTGLCQQATGRSVDVGRVVETRPGDVPLYLTDNSLVQRVLGWEPKRTPVELVSSWA